MELKLLNFKKDDWVFTIQHGVCQIESVSSLSGLPCPYTVGEHTYHLNGTLCSNDKYPSLYTLQDALSNGFINGDVIKNRSHLILESESLITKEDQKKLDQYLKSHGCYMTLDQLRHAFSLAQETLVELALPPYMDSDYKSFYEMQIARAQGTLDAIAKLCADKETNG